MVKYEINEVVFFVKNLFLNKNVASFRTYSFSQKLEIIM